MTKEKLHAISQVLLVNRDICELYEKRGVSREDMMEVFRLATIAVSDPDFEEIKAKAKAAWSESQKGRRDLPRMIQDGLNVVVKTVFDETKKAMRP